MELQIVKRFVEEMAGNSSTLAKKDILRKYAGDVFLVKILQYTYHPLKQYFVTEKTIEKRIGLIDLQKNPPYTHIFDLLDALASRAVTGHDAIDAVNGYISLDESVRDIVYQILEKNLKTRATESIINEVIPGCIPVFEVQLAHRYDEYLEKIEKESEKINESIAKGKKPKERRYKLDFVGDTWYASTKLDGLRCVAIIDQNGKCTFYSRSGKEFTTLSLVASEIESFGFRNVVFDGEICLRTADDTDDFQGIMKEYNKKDHTIQNPLYYFFDFMPLEVFLNPDSHQNVLFSQRLTNLSSAVYGKKREYTSILSQTPVTSLEHIEKLKVEAINSGREGLILKRNTKYQNERTNDILKVKVFFDAEYEVLGTKNDVLRIVEGGREVEEEMLKNVQVMHKGNIVDVGSGWNLAERREYFVHPKNIVGKLITVQYFEETVDQHGKPSLRFPTVKAIHGTERAV